MNLREAHLQIIHKKYSLKATYYHHGKVNSEMLGECILVVELQF